MQAASREEFRPSLGWIKTGTMIGAGGTGIGTESGTETGIGARVGAVAIGIAIMNGGASETDLVTL